MRLTIKLRNFHPLVDEILVPGRARPATLAEGRGAGEVRAGDRFPGGDKGVEVLRRRSDPCAGELSDDGALSQAEIVAAINPFSETSEYTQIVCVIAPFEVTAGRMTSAPRTLILTDRIRILSQNTVDFRTEHIDVNVRTMPVKSISVSATEVLNPYVKIVGTLAEPRNGTTVRNRPKPSAPGAPTMAVFAETATE